MNRKRTFINTLILPGVFLALIFVSHCVNLGRPHGKGPGGALLTTTTIGVGGTRANGPLRGEACVHRIFLWAAVGKGTIKDAVQGTQIKTIYTIDQSAFNIFGFFLGGIYSNLCTIVTGTDEVNATPDSKGGGGVTGFTDTVILKDGRKITRVKATITPAGEIVITDTKGQVQVLKKSQVKSIIKN